MMPEVFFVENESALIPFELLKAIQGFSGFCEVHINYWTRNGGLEGMCTYQDAFDRLVSDLREHNLPVTYSSFNSFKVQKSKNRK